MTIKKNNKKSVLIHYYIYKELPFIDNVLEQINKLNQENIDITIKIHNKVNKYNNSLFINKLTNYKDKLILPQNKVNISKILFEDIEFKIPNGTAILNNNTIESIDISDKVLKRLKSLIFNEEKEDLKIIIDDESKSFVIKPSVYKNNNFYKKFKEERTDITEKIQIEDAISKKYNYYIYLDNYVYIDNINIIDNLIACNKKVISPVLKMAGGQSRCNFEVRPDNKELMLLILQDKLKGEWSVNKIACFYLIDLNKYSTDINELYISNNFKTGWIICDTMITQDKAHPELYNLKENRLIWHRVFLKKDFYDYIENNKLMKITEPKKCPDIFEWHCFTDTFCKYLIDECEKYGKWSNGENKDNRLNSGYENVPTRDIHLKQIGLGDVWKEFVTKYISRVASKTFNNINTRGYNIAFVVKYTMDTQKDLKPHHDSSIHSTVTCLNNEFTGGGTHFIRQKYIHNPKTLGMTSIHPGRCTHYHEGLPIKSGKRYLLISFNE